MLYLSKLLPLLIFPVGLTIFLLLMSRLCSRLGHRRAAILTYAGAIALLWWASTPIVANWAEASLERQFPLQSIAESPTADAAIVLGGAVRQPLRPNTESRLSSASDRILRAARLYRAGKVKVILVAAGNIPWLHATRAEAELIKELLIEWGVPENAIELGSQSRNTYENAMEIKQIWSMRDLKSALLITSAAHMPRAMATFQRVGLPVIASAADVHMSDNGWGDDFLDWLPDASALDTTTKAMREWLGLLVYKACGYA